MSTSYPNRYEGPPGPRSKERRGEFSRALRFWLGLGDEDSKSAYLFVEVERCILDGQLDSFMKTGWRSPDLADYRQHGCMNWCSSHGQLYQYQGLTADEACWKSRG